MQLAMCTFLRVAVLDFFAGDVDGWFWFIGYVSKIVGKLRCVLFYFVDIMRNHVSWKASECLCIG